MQVDRSQDTVLHQAYTYLRLPMPVRKTTGIPALSIQIHLIAFAGEEICRQQKAVLLYSKTIEV